MLRNPFPEGGAQPLPGAHAGRALSKYFLMQNNPKQHITKCSEANRVMESQQALPGRGHCEPGQEALWSGAFLFPPFTSIPAACPWGAAPCPARVLLPPCCSAGPGAALLVLSSPGRGRSHGHPVSWALLLSPLTKEMLLTQTAFQHYLQECCHSTFPVPPLPWCSPGSPDQPRGGRSPCLWWAASSAAAAPSTDRPLLKAH